MNFIILDTETAKYNHGMRYYGMDTVYNIAWTVMTKSGKIKIQRSFLVADVYNQMFLDLKQNGTQWADKNYYTTKSVFYKSQLNKVTFMVKWVDILQTLITDIKTYDISFITAYNVGFDKRVIHNTTELLTKQGQITNIPNTIQILDDRFNIYDIRIGALNTICQTKKYVNFCVENNFLSDSCLEFRTKAETLIRYIRNNPFIEESHTALEDVQIEAEIFSRVLKKQSILTPCEGNPKFFVYNALHLLSKQNTAKLIEIWQQHKDKPTTSKQTKNKIEKILAQMV